MNDFQTFLRTRRSIRRFLGPAATDRAASTPVRDGKTGRPDPVPASVIERILETATYAPSAHNLQPWRFAVVTDLSAKDRLGVALTDKMRADMVAESAPQDEIDARIERSLRRIHAAPVIILLCRDTTAIRKDEPEEVTMAVQSVALAGLQLLLAAHAEGLGGNWICWPLYAQEAARKALKLPDTWEPQGMIFLGYADGEPREKVLKPLKELVMYV
jgi:coenzyme F420-0:L-glutamate ligase/coenzyme F420-1:gamma-L-glutamate ligase